MMPETGLQKDIVNSKTGMTLDEAKDFVRRHFDDFVNRKKLDVAEINFAAEF